MKQFAISPIVVSVSKSVVAVVPFRHNNGLRLRRIWVLRSYRSASCRVVFLRLVAEKHSNKPLCRFGDHVVNRNAAHNFLDTQVLSFSTRPPTSAHAQTHSHTNLGTRTLIITATEKQHHEQKRPPCWKGEAHKTLTFSQRQRTRKRPRVCVCVCIYFCLCIRCVVDNAAHRTKEVTRKE